MVKDRKVKVASANKGALLFYAVKVQKSAEHYTEAAMDEVELLDCIAKEIKKVEAACESTPSVKDKDGIPITAVVDHSRHVAILHDSFFHNGPHGKHMCMVFSMLGCNLLSVIKAHNYRGIPLPAVKKMIQGVTKGLDFLHRKCNIIHTDLKPENVLLQFPGQLNSDPVQGGEDDAAEDNDQTVTIEELEALLRNPKTSTDERKKIRKKLKKRRQRDKKRTDNEDEDTSDAENGNGGNFSDARMEHLLNQQDKKLTKNAHERVLSRLSHSQFVMKNFSPRVSANGSEPDLIDDMVKVSRPSKSELSAHFQLCNAQVGSRSGVAEVSFILRAFVPEGEIADNMSAALSGIPWELSDEDDATREWCVESSSLFDGSSFHSFCLIFFFPFTGDADYQSNNQENNQLQPSLNWCNMVAKILTID